MSSEPVVFLSDGVSLYAVPKEICKQYVLEGKSLESAKNALAGDVEGQSTWHTTGTEYYMTNSRGEAYTLNSQGSYQRAPQYD